MLQQLFLKKKVKLKTTTNKANNEFQ